MLEIHLFRDCSEVKESFLGCFECFLGSAHVTTAPWKSGGCGVENQGWSIYIYIYTCNHIYLCFAWCYRLRLFFDPTVYEACDQNQNQNQPYIYEPFDIMYIYIFNVIIRIIIYIYMYIFSFYTYKWICRCDHRSHPMSVYHFEARDYALWESCILSEGRKTMRQWQNI